MKKSIAFAVLLSAGMVDSRAHAQVDNAGDGVTPSVKCGDTNGDKRVDISDAIRILAFIFSGGPPPVCPVQEPPPPLPSEPTREVEIEQMLIEKGDAVFALTSQELLAVDGTEPHLFIQAGIQLFPGNNFAVAVDTDGLTRELPIVYVNASTDLLDIALTLQDSGDPVEITYRYSDCIGPVSCDETCHTAGLWFHAIDTPVGKPLRCQRVQEEKMCTDKMKAICTRQLYRDKNCRQPFRPPFSIEGWRCN